MVAVWIVIDEKIRNWRLHMLQHMKTHHTKHMTAEEFLGNFNSERADVITGLREKEELSRREAAIQLGISPKELKAVETARKAPTKDLIFKMHKLYCTSLRKHFKSSPQGELFFIIKYLIIQKLQNNYCIFS